MLTICCRWQIENVYREHVAILKLAFGNQGNGQRITFVGITSHGSSRNKHQKFIAHFDGIDFAISGHSHSPMYVPHSKIRISSNGKATQVPYKEIVVDANLKVGGYGLKNEYEIATNPELQMLELSAYRGSDDSRKLHRVMNYRTITI